MYKKPKGTQDIFGERQKYNTFVVDVLETIASFYNYKKIETPIFESKEVFKRSSGETSDIVNKEMYEFKDKKNRELVLKPEGTAGIVRAFVENKMFGESMPKKLFYNGPIFRYERPQKGRQRQFTQFGVELLGVKSPAADAEVIMLGNSIIETLKLSKTKLLINSLGDKKSRNDYSEALKTYLIQFKSELSEVSIERLEKNPLRILDDKVDGEKDFIKKAPKLSNYLTDEAKIYFKGVMDILDASNIKYEISEKLVRGLDYYTDVVFEFVSESDVAGTQATLIAGGRYDNMIKQFGGPDLSAVGLGVGIERLVNEVEETDLELPEDIDVYLINLELSTTSASAAITNILRAAGFVTESNLEPIKLNKGFEKAKVLNAKFVIISGPKELENGNIIIKNQENGQQNEVSIEELIEFLDERL